MKFSNLVSWILVGPILPTARHHPHHSPPALPVLKNVAKLLPVHINHCLIQQDHRRWRYHRRLLDYQSPYFQLIFHLNLNYRSSNSFGSLKFIFLIELTFRSSETWGSTNSFGTAKIIFWLKILWISWNSKKIPRISQHPHQTQWINHRNQTHNTQLGPRDPPGLPDQPEFP